MNDQDKTRVRRVLIFQGGWDGHAPATMATIFREGLECRGFAVEIADWLGVLAERDLSAYDLIVPIWTMGTIETDALAALVAAVRGGTGLAGVHGGMCDSFRGQIDYQWMTGGQFLGHPHVGSYTVCRTGVDHPITAGLPMAFEYSSEQYYMMVDPAVRVLADTVYELEEHRVRMPVVWTRQWGKGRVFFSALGHQPNEYTRYPFVLEMTLKGMEWAARA